MPRQPWFPGGEGGGLGVEGNRLGYINRGTFGDGEFFNIEMVSFRLEKRN